MIINIEGNINRYYVQTLCMIFFPGEKFGEEELEREDAPKLSLKVVKQDGEYTAYVTAENGGKRASAEKTVARNSDLTDDRCCKVAVGKAVIAALGDLLEYRPSWGMLTGVRPTKVATELLDSGISKTRTKKILSGYYHASAKKAALATEVALNEKRIIGTPSAADCSLYVSIPFCPSRCAYCSFVSYTSKNLISLIPDYVDRAVKDIREILKKANEIGLNVKTVYIGGGTPSILSSNDIARILGVICEYVDVSKLEEFTFEAGRPDTIELDKLITAKRFGVDRISVNPQTLSHEVLEKIGRMHTVEDFYRAFSIAREAEIKYINTDLIAGLPGDSFSTFAKSINGIIALEPENVTVHTLCIKRSSALRQQPDAYSLRGGDAGKCVDFSQMRLREAGYSPYYMYRQKNAVGNYENVGFSATGAEGKYNIYMMEEIHTILAVGAGAVTKFVRNGINGGDKKVIKRFFNPKYPYEYLSGDNCDALVQGIESFYDEYPI